MQARAVFFCDDVRSEHGNKLSAMGIYNERIVFAPGEGVMILPKLAVVFVISGMRGRDEVRFRQRLAFDNAPSTADPPVQMIRRDAANDEQTFVMQITPAVFPKAGSLTAWLEIVGATPPPHFEVTVRVERASKAAMGSLDIAPGSLGPN